jgi:hypothetical protein
MLTALDSSDVSASSTGWLVPKTEVFGHVELITSTTIYLCLQGAAFPNGLVVSVHDARGTVPHSPCSVHIEDWSLLHTGAINVDHAVIVEDDILTIFGAFVLRCWIGSSHTWGPPVPITPALNGRSVDAGVESQLADAEARLGSRWLNLMESLSPESDLDHIRITNALLRIVGFGPGLTPSGDDALAGLLLGLRWWGQDITMFTYLRERVLDILEIGQTQTTTISAQMLHFACVGIGNELVHEVLASVADRDSTQSCDLLMRLCQVGATSGADTLLGLRTASRLLETSRPVPV